MQMRSTLIELFELLEEYAPTWYSEEHHSRAMRALGQSADPGSLNGGSSPSSRLSRSSDARGAEKIRSNKGTRRAPLMSRKG
jgi:hypothetical protein